MTEILNDNNAQGIQIKPSTFDQYYFTTEISDHRYSYRVLKMNESLFVYIGETGNESFNEMALAVPIPKSDSSRPDYVGTTIIGEQINSSDELAIGFAKKLNKPIYLSCNIPMDRDIRPVVAKRFTEEVNKFPEKF